VTARERDAAAEARRWQHAAILYRAGATTREIGDTFGVSGDTVRRRLTGLVTFRDPGAQLRPTLDAPTDPVPDELRGQQLGRPRRYLDEELTSADIRREAQAAICRQVEAGNLLETAAARVGIKRVTIYTWMQRGRLGEPGYSDFLRDYETAKHNHLARRIGRINEIADLTNVKDLNAVLRANQWIATVLDPVNYGQALPPDARKVYDTILGLIERHAPPEVYARILDDLGRLAGRAPQQVGPDPADRPGQLGEGPGTVCAGVLGPAADSGTSGDHPGSR
jgi:transposase